MTCCASRLSLPYGHASVLRYQEDGEIDGERQDARREDGNHGRRGVCKVYPAVLADGWLRHLEARSRISTSALAPAMKRQAHQREGEHDDRGEGRLVKQQLVRVQAEVLLLRLDQDLRAQ
jgi:hypothetical protein